MVKKFYMETKDNTLESAILDVWKNAAENNMSGEQSYEIGTDRYRKHTQDMTPGQQVEEGLEDSPNPANSWHLCAKNVIHEDWGKGETVPTMHADPDEEGNIAWYDVMFEHGVEKGVSINELKVTKEANHMHASYDKTNDKKKKMAKETNKNDKSDDGEGLDAVQPKAVKKKFDDRKDKDIDNDGDTDDSDEFLHKKRKAISKAIDAKESFNLRDTIVNMWTEASSAVNPNDRDELDGSKNATGRGGVETAKKMKRAAEPAPAIATEDISIEEAQKQKVLSMKEALAKVWEYGMQSGSGGNPSAGDRTSRPMPKRPMQKKPLRRENNKGKTTDTGGKMAEVEIDPEIKEKNKK